MYAIYGYIYHQYTPNVSIYTIYIPYMDPMGSYWKLAIEIVDLPIKNGGFSIVFCKRLPEGIGDRSGW